MAKKTKWIKHINKENSRKHYPFWDSGGQHCSEPNCEINKPLKKSNKK